MFLDQEQLATNPQPGTNQEKLEMAKGGTLEKQEKTLQSQGDSVEAKLDRLIEKSQDKLKDLLKNKADLKGEIGQDRYQDLIRAQLRRLSYLKEKLARKHGDLKKIHEGERGSIFNEAEDELNQLYAQVEATIAILGQKGNLTEKDAIKLKGVLEGLTEMEGDKPLEQLFQKIAKGEELTAQDYGALIEKMTLQNLRVDPKKNEFPQAFAASKVFALLTLMNEGQRMQLVLNLAKTPSKQNEAAQMIEILVVNNFLSLEDVQKLLKDELLPPQTALYLQRKFDNGTLAKKQDEMREKTQALIRQWRGKFASGTTGGIGLFGNNQFERGLSEAFLPGVGGLWGLTTALANMMAGSWTGLYSLGGIAVLGASLYSLGPKMFPALTQDIKEIFDDKVNPEKVKEKAKNNLKTIFAQNPSLRDFLVGKDKAKPSFQTLHDLQEKRAAESKNFELSYQELKTQGELGSSGQLRKLSKPNVSLKLDFDQLKALERARNFYITEDRFDAALNKVLISAKTLEIKNNEDLIALVQSFNEDKAKEKSINQKNSQ